MAAACGWWNADQKACHRDRDQEPLDELRGSLACESHLVLAGQFRGTRRPRLNLTSPWIARAKGDGCMSGNEIALLKFEGRVGGPAGEAKSRAAALLVWLSDRQTASDRPTDFS